MSAARSLLRRFDEIDVQAERIRRLIENAMVIDPEMAAGLATTEPMLGIQREIDRAAVACEELAGHVKAVERA